MAGVNLSQAAALAQENKKKRLFASSGLVVSIILLGLTLVGWGGLRWYIHFLNQKIATLESTISANSSRLTGDSVDRVADFGARMKLMGSDPAEMVDPKPILEKLESLIVPQVTLDEYTHDDAGGKSTIVGRAENYRYLAEQIMSLKSDPIFSQIQVGALSRDDKGAVVFTLTNNF